MFSTLFNIFYGDFSGFCHYVFKVIYCSFVVCVKGLNMHAASGEDNVFYYKNNLFNISHVIRHKAISTIVNLDYPCISI